MATSPEGSKTNFRMIIYTQSSANSENLAAVDVEIIGLTNLLKRNVT